MIVVGIIAAWWLALAFVAWALCRIAHESDEAIETMHPRDWEWSS